jgi:hypothetical protein
LAFGYGIYAVRRATDRWPAYLGLTLAGLELAAGLVLVGAETLGWL